MTQIKTAPKTMIVHYTDDLDIFQFIKGNRPPSPKHIDKIAKSMEVIGCLCNPIIVNEKLQIIDGQHRYMAAKKVGIGIYYIIVDGYRLEEVHALNAINKSWSKKDFLEGYVSMGLPDYIKLNNFVKANHDLNINTCISLCSGLSDTHSDNMNKTFNSGLFVFVDGLEAQRRADILRTIGKYFEGYSSRSFVSAMQHMFKHKDFVDSEFIHKLKLQQGAMYKCATAEQYKVLIEEIYNYKRRDKVNLRF